MRTSEYIVHLETSICAGDLAWHMENYWGSFATFAVELTKRDGDKTVRGQAAAVAKCPGAEQVPAHLRRLADEVEAAIAARREKD